MKIDWLLLLASVLLLWTPTILLMGGPARSRLRNPARNQKVTFPQMALTPLNWIDLLRAAAGVFMLQSWALLPDPTFPGSGVAAMLLRFLIIGLGVFLQSGWVADRLVVMGPTFYLAGLTVALAPWQVWSFALVLGLVAAGLLHRFRWHLATSLGALVAFAALFRAFQPSTLVALSLWMLPLLLNIRANDPIAFLHRRSSLDRRRYAAAAR